MNTLEQLITFDEVNLQETAFSNGVYINLRHNTDDIDAIINSFSRIYRVLFQTVKGTKPVLDYIYSSPRVPVESRVRECLTKAHPLMVSSVERKQLGYRYQSFSHHFLYGTHLVYKFQTDDDKLVSDISNSLLNNINTVDNHTSNILIQPVGATEAQATDRFSQDEYFNYISSPLNDDGSDTLLTHMVKSSPPMKYALQYSYHR